MVRLFDPGILLQAIGRLARERSTAHREPLALPSRLGCPQHPALASARGARHGRDPLPAGHVPHRGPLLGRQIGVRLQRGLYMRGAHAMRSGPRQALGLGHHIALGLDHRPRGEARGRPALPGRELLKLRRGHDPREGRLERLALVHVAVDFAGDIPAGEYGLPVGDKFQHPLRPLRDLAGALGAGVFEILDALQGLAGRGHRVGLHALVHGRRDIEPGIRVAPVVDADAVTGARQVQVRVVRPLLAQLDQNGWTAQCAGEIVADAPALIPERLSRLRVQDGHALGLEARIRQRPHREQDVSVEIAVAALLVVDGPIRAQARGWRAARLRIRASARCSAQASVRPEVLF